jgi:hypothetical protein
MPQAVARTGFRSKKSAIAALAPRPCANSARSCKPSPESAKPLPICMAVGLWFGSDIMIRSKLSLTRLSGQRCIYQGLHQFFHKKIP